MTTMRAAVGLLFACVLGAGAPPPGTESGAAESSASDPSAGSGEREPYDPELAAKTVAFWQDRVKQDPEGHLDLRQLASAYLARQRETGNIEDAVKAEDAARRSLRLMKERNAGALIRLGRSLLAQHRFPEALEAAKQAAQLDPAASRLVADIQIELGDYDAAEEALNVDPPQKDDLNYLAIRAHLDEIGGHRDAALRRWRDACEIVDARPDMSAETAAWTLTMLGHGLIDLGRLDEGENACRKALTIFPRDYRAMTGMAEASAWRQDWKAAAEWAGKAIAVCPQNPEAIRISGEALAKLGKPKESEEAIHRLGELCRSFPRIYDRHWILFCADEGRDLDQALRLARSDLALRKDVFAYDTLAWVLFKQGQIADAKSAMDKALSRGTGTAPLFYHAGMIAKAGGDHDGARTFFAKASQRNLYLMKSVNVGDSR